MRNLRTFLLVALLASPVCSRAEVTGTIRVGNLPGGQDKSAVFATPRRGAPTSCSCSTSVG